MKNSGRKTRRMLLLTLLMMLFAIAAVQTAGVQEAQAATTVKKVSGVSVTAKSTSSVKISWKKVSGASGYQIYRKTGSGSWKKLKTITSGSTLSYTNKSLKTGTTYQYKVRAYVKSDSGTTKGSFSSVKKFVGGTPPKVTGVSVKKNTSSGLVKVSWTKVSGASGYQIYRRTGTGSWKKVKTIKSGSTTSWKNTGLSTGKTYQYKVRAYVKKSSKTYKGSFSAVKQTTLHGALTTYAKAQTYLSSKNYKVTYKADQYDYTDVISDDNALTYYVYDFDSDGTDELLIIGTYFAASSTTSYVRNYGIVKIYELEDDAAILTDAYNVTPGIVGNSEESFVEWFVYESGGKVYFGCESFAEGIHYADGVAASITVLRYTGGEIKKVTSWENSGSDFSGENKTVTNSKLGISFNQYAVLYAEETIARDYLDADIICVSNAVNVLDTYPYEEGDLLCKIKIKSVHTGALTGLDVYRNIDYSYLD